MAVKWTKSDPINYMEVTWKELSILLITLIWISAIIFGGLGPLIVIPTIVIYGSTVRLDSLKVAARDMIPLQGHWHLPATPTSADNPPRQISRNSYLANFV
jgi:hypothetical protein